MTRLDLNTDDARARLYARVVARDAAADGVFLTCVQTTGIYCLPSCKARKPLLRNVVFLATEAEAVAAGFRPCHVCRPELFYRGESWDEGLYAGLTTRAERAIADIPDVPALAALCGVGTSKLGDLFRRHAHGTPADFLRRTRVAAAGQLLLLRSRDDATEIGLAVGFDSVSTFYRQFRDVTGMAPGAWRRLVSEDRFEIGLPDGYDPGAALRHAAMDPGQLCERSDPAAGRIHKAVDTRDSVVVLDLQFRPGAARCTIHRDGPLSATGRMAVHGAALKMLGLASRAAEDFEARAANEPPVSRLVGTRRGHRLPQTLSAFEALVWALVGQQISIRFAAELRQALIHVVRRRAPLGLWAHPWPGEVAALDVADLIRRRYSRAKAVYLIEAARHIATRQLPLEDLARGSAEAAERRLRAVRGIGVWTARYTLLRGAGFADCAPVGDSGLATGLQRLNGLANRPSISEAERLMQPFAPHRSLATAHLWAMVQEAAAAARAPAGMRRQDVA